jgi:hypothetical protein
MDDGIESGVTWNSQLERILSEEGEKCLCFSWLHDRAEKKFTSLHTYITIPSIILATLSGSASIGTTALINNSTIANLVIGTTTLSVGLLGTISSFFAWAKRAEAHRIATITYKKVYKFMLIELALPRTERMQAKDMLKVVRDETQRLEETCPQIPDDIIRLFKQKFEKNTPEVTKPEITNGLHPIYVYPGDADSPFSAAGRGEKAVDSLLDPMYRTPGRSDPIKLIIPTNAIKSTKISNDDHILDMTQKLSSAHPPSESVEDSSHN